MPAERVGPTGAAIHRYDVVATDATAAGPHGYIAHLGLSLSGQSVNGFGARVKVLHMAPPYGTGEMAAHAVGVVPLTADERNRVKIFLDNVDSELKAVTTQDQFVVCPHVVARRERDGTVTHRRFSCAELVIEAYKSTEVVLLDVSEAPPVCIDTLEKVYPDLRTIRMDLGPFSRDLLRDVGLDGTGGWPVVLPGYVLHALNRPEDEIRRCPYRPKKGDEFFL